MTKKIAIIGTVGLPAIYGGFETLVEYLTLNLSGKYEITVYCSAKTYAKKLDSHNNAKLVYVPLNANGIQSIPYDIYSYIHALFYADTFLILGVSGCIFLPILKLFNNKKIIVNIDGLEWKRNKWNTLAKKFLKFSERIAVRFADVVVADNKVIQTYVFEEYGVRSELIAYGADHVKKVEISAETLKLYPFLKSDFAFTVCRIEPENNVHMILEAISQLSGGVQIVFIGNWQASSYGIALYEQYSKFENIKLLNPIYDQDVLNQFRSNCLVYVHGHSAGGTNPSLVEAMYLGLPIFAFAVGYNRETTENATEYFANSEGLKSLFLTINKSHLNDLGVKMAEIANKRYCWKIISDQYSNLM